jgi:hypothetical protein
LEDDSTVPSTLARRNRLVRKNARLLWRRGWDSNPRLSFPNTRFPSVLLKPLGHLSEKQGSEPNKLQTARQTRAAGTFRERPRSAHGSGPSLLLRSAELHPNHYRGWLRVLETFRALGIEFVSLSESLDTATPAGRMVFTVLGARRRNRWQNHGDWYLPHHKRVRGPLHPPGLGAAPHFEIMYSTQPRHFV